jgi:hypothetical protein
LGQLFSLSVTSVEGRKEDISSKDAQRFFESFHMLTSVPKKK